MSTTGVGGLGLFRAINLMLPAVTVRPLAGRISLSLQSAAERRFVLLTSKRLDLFLLAKCFRVHFSEIRPYAEF